MYDDSEVGTPPGNDNGKIDEYEYLNAVQDYYDGIITYEQVSEVHALYNLSIYVEDPIQPIIYFMVNLNDYTLTVISISEGNFTWDDAKIEFTDEQNSTVVYAKIGTIKAGDTINVGNLGLVGLVNVYITWKPTDELLYTTQINIEQEGQGWISGQVVHTEQTSGNTNTTIGLLLSNVKISVYNLKGVLLTYTFTDNSGRYLIMLDVGSYRVKAEKEGYATTSRSPINVFSNRGSTVDFDLERVEIITPGWITGTVYATVTNENLSYSYPLQGVIVVLQDASGQIHPYNISDGTTTDKAGKYTIFHESGAFTVKAYKDGYYTSHKQVVINKGEGTTVDFYLKKINTSEECCSIFGTVFEMINETVVPLGNVTVSISRIDSIVLSVIEPRPMEDMPISKTKQNVELSGLSEPIIRTSTSIDKKYIYDATTTVEKKSDQTVLTKSIEVWKLKITDKNGNYWFDSLEPGSYQIRVNKQGFETQTKNVVVKDKPVEADFYLEKSSITIYLEGIIMPINYTTAHYREIGGSTQYIDEAILTGDVGGEIIVDGMLQSSVLQYDELMTITPITLENGELSLMVSGDHSLSGKTIVISAADGLFDRNGDLLIKYDGVSIQLADDLADVLNPNDDGSLPEYLILIGANGIQIMVSIPHFSDHFISIQSVAQVIDAIGGINALILYVAISVIAAVIFVGSIKIRKKF